jgi:hypothetical protein
MVASASDVAPTNSRRDLMTDAIKAQSDVLSERELDCVSGGLIKGEVGVCRKGEGTSGEGGPMGMLQQIMQQLTQGY